MQSSLSQRSPVSPNTLTLSHSGTVLESSVESVVSAVQKVTLIRPRISTTELHCVPTLRPPEVDQTGITAAPPQDSQVHRYVEELRISA